MEDDRYTNAPEYSSRGRYGDPTQRCAWCGKPTTYSDRMCIGGFFRRNYCSRSCQAAGDFYPNLAIAIIYPLIVLVIIWSIQVSAGTGFSESILFPAIYIGILPTICLWCCVFLGRSERKGS